jgi:hypothetical protein
LVGTAVKNKLKSALSYSHALIPPNQRSTYQYPTAIADTGATGHYITQSDSNQCTNKTYTDIGPNVSAASGTVMKATHSLTVPLAPQLSATAEEGHLLNGLTNNSLVSIGKLCDDDCTAIFTKDFVRVKKDDTVIITGRIKNNHTAVLILVKILRAIASHY